MAKQVRTHLMFDGSAEEAMNFYAGLFPGSEVVESSRYDGGEVLMPLDNYGFSSKFGWLIDRFGVSWQLNLP